MLLTEALCVCRLKVRDCNTAWRKGTVRSVQSINHVIKLLPAVTFQKEHRELKHYSTEPEFVLCEVLRITEQLIVKNSSFWYFSFPPFFLFLVKGVICVSSVGQAFRTDVVTSPGACHK